MKRREFVGAGLALTAAWPLKGWSAVLKNVGDVAAKSLDGGDLVLRGFLDRGIRREPAGRSPAAGQSGL